MTLPGGVDHTGKVDLKDAILALKTSAGMTEKVFPDADVNKNGKIGIAKIIYILQLVAGIR